MLKAQNLMVQKEWVLAEKSVRDFLSRNPGNGDAHALLGISLYHQKLYDACVGELEISLANRTDYASRAILYLGLAYSKLGMKTESIDMFSRLLAEYPDSSEARHIRGIDPDVTVQADQRTGLDVSGTVISIDAGFDSNPLLIDGGDSDLLTSLYFYTDFSFDSLPCFVGTSLFMDKYLDQTENDFIYAAINLNNRHSLSSEDVIEWSVEAGQSVLDYDLYERELYGAIEHTHPFGSLWASEIRALLGAVDGDDNGNDGLKEKLRVRLSRYLYNSGRLRRYRLKTELNINDRDEELVSYESIVLGVDCRVSFSKVSLDLSCTFDSREYEGVDPVTGEKREDDKIEISAFALRPIAQKQYLTGQIIYTDRDSTDSFYEAEELQFFVGLLWVN